MKKIPESYELNEEDIKAAIGYWLNNFGSKPYAGEFEVRLTMNHSKTTVSAVATVKE